MYMFSTYLKQCTREKEVHLPVKYSSLATLTSGPLVQPSLFFSPSFSFLFCPLSSSQILPYIPSLKISLSISFSAKTCHCDFSRSSFLARVVNILVVVYKCIFYFTFYFLSSQESDNCCLFYCRRRSKTNLE